MACSVCGASGGSTCGECKDVQYCSRECQKAGWREHKGVCATFKRLAQLERTIAAQERRLDVVATKLKFVENPCFCCGLQRAVVTDVMLSCCGLVIHGMCLMKERARGECPDCGEPLPADPETLYAQAAKLTTLNNYRLQKGDVLVPEDICEVHNMHLDAAKQGHLNAQMRIHETYSMGVIVDRNPEVALYFLALAARQLPCMGSSKAKILLGDHFFERGEDVAAQREYYGALQYYASVRLTLKEANKAVDGTCAKIFNRMGEIMRRKGDSSKAALYFEQAVAFDGRIAAYYYDLGVQHAINGDFVKAEEAHRCCLHLNPKHALGQYAVGFLLAKKGDKKAAAFFTRAQKLGHMGAKKQLERLQIK